MPNRHPPTIDGGFSNLFDTEGLSPEQIPAYNGLMMELHAFSVNSDEWRKGVKRIREFLSGKSDQNSTEVKEDLTEESILIGMD